MHGVDERGKPVLKKQLKRDQLAPFFAVLAPCLIGMEACGSAHHWARKLQGFGHTVKLMAPQFVKPYVKTNKNEIPGVGPITASALVASVGDAKSFANGRQMASWLGLVPRQHSSGGKSTLLGISKRGDSYLRTLLVHGARAVVRYPEGKTDPSADWLKGLLTRRNTNVAVIAQANKNARTAWALLAHDRRFRSGYTPAVAGA